MCWVGRGAAVISTAVGGTGLGEFTVSVSIEGVTVAVSCEQAVSARLALTIPADCKKWRRFSMPFSLTPQNLLDPAGSISPGNGLLAAVNEIFDRYLFVGGLVRADHDGHLHSHPISIFELFTKF